MSEERIAGWVEGVGRWAAARMSRRSFIGRLGQGAVLVAGGPVLASLLAEPAGARVCGQTGVSRLCPTYDCIDGVWGWCWYATGCCAGGSLKKICDCCIVRYPNVHGYCPPGTNVACLVESCGEDPRLMRVSLNRLITDDVLALTRAVRQALYPSGAETVVIGDSDDQLFAAVAVALAGIVRAPLHLVVRGALSTGAQADLITSRATRAIVVGSLLPTTVDGTLRSHGLSVERVGTERSIVTFSSQVADWVTANYGLRSRVAITSSGLSALAAPFAAAFSAGAGAPLVVDPSPLSTPVYLVGPEAAAGASGHASPITLNAPDLPTIATLLAERARTEGTMGTRVALAPTLSVALMPLAAFGAPLLAHDANSAAPAASWISANASGLTEAWLGGHLGSMGLPALKTLQSALNGFAADKLIGVGGQGLPVLSQTLPERVIGAARR